LNNPNIIYHKSNVNSVHLFSFIRYKLSSLEFIGFGNLTLSKKKKNSGQIQILVLKGLNVDFHNAVNSDLGGRNKTEITKFRPRSKIAK
jgi:hypothetical protein